MTALRIIVGGGKLEGRILEKMHERIIKKFMDILILVELRNRPMSVYDTTLSLCSQQIPSSSELRYSLLTSLFTRKKRDNYRNMERKKKSIQTYQKRHKNN